MNVSPTLVTYCWCCVAPLRIYNYVFNAGLTTIQAQLLSVSLPFGVFNFYRVLTDWSSCSYRGLHCIHMTTEVIFLPRPALHSGLHCIHMMTEVMFLPRRALHSYDDRGSCSYRGLHCIHMMTEVMFLPRRALHSYDDWGSWSYRGVTAFIWRLR